MTGSPGFQYEEICRIAGPLNPWWVISSFSRKLCLPMLATTSVEIPAKSQKRFVSAGFRVKATSAGRGSTIFSPNCCARS